PCAPARPAEPAGRAGTPPGGPRPDAQRRGRDARAQVELAGRVPAHRRPTRPGWPWLRYPRRNSSTSGALLPTPGPTTAPEGTHAKVSTPSAASPTSRSVRSIATSRDAIRSRTVRPPARNGGSEIGRAHV